MFLIFAHRDDPNKPKQSMFVKKNKENTVKFLY